MNTEDSNKFSDPPSAPRPHRKGHQRVWLLSVAILGAMGFFLFQQQEKTQPKGGNKPGGQQPPPAIPVAVATAQQGDIGDYVNALGYVTPLNTVTARSRVDGELLRVNYREG